MKLCRCKSGHRYEPGHADLSGNCVVQGVKRSNYQVLVDTFAMARLEWRRWDMFMVASLGSVAYNERTFVGEMTSSQGERRIAELDYQRGLSGEFVVEVSLDTEESATQGWVLIETEPIKYNMENVTFLSEKIVSTESVLLGEVRLERKEGEGSGDWSEVEASLEYRWEGEESWGNIGGVVRGLPCTVTRHHTTIHTWAGLTTNITHQDRLQVRLDLQAGTGVNISVVGEVVSVDQVYTATLLSVFADGSLAVSDLRGVRTSHRLADIQYKHHGPLWLQSGLPAPTTPTPPPPSSSTVRTSQPPPPSPPATTPRRQEEREVGPPVTLFPPPPPPVTRPNPLKQFYPDPGDEEEDEDGVTFENIVRVDILPLSPAARNTLNIGILLLLLCNSIL